MQVIGKTIKEIKISPEQFILFFTLLNLVQAAFTGLHNDESYYWVYTHQLALGYYDHPPMIAICMLLGKSLIQGELGLRLGSILFMSFGLWVFLRMYPKDWLRTVAPFYLLFSIPFLNYLSFTIWPDAPLIAFSVLLFYGYKAFLTQANWKAIFVMAISLAGMLYSKYHGILVVPLLVVSNWSLLRKWQIYAVFSMAFLLFLPHLVWQYHQEFPSFLYHLSGRSTAFQWKFPARFLVEQLAVVGPLIVASMLYKPKNAFEKFLRVLVQGFYVFFFVLSIRGVVHMQWTSLTYLPIAYLSTGFYLQTKKKKLLLAFCAPFFLLTLLLRFYLSTGLFPGEKLGPNYVHGQKEWAEAVAELSGDLAMVFENDLKIPSTYSYYSGNPGIAVYPGYRKKSQYDLWHMEDSLQLIPVIIAKKDFFNGSQQHLSSTGPKIYYRLLDEFTSYQNIKINLLGTGKSENGYEVKVEVVNHRNHDLLLDPDQLQFLLIGVDKDTAKKTIQMSAKRVVVPSQSSLPIALIAEPLDALPKGTFVIGIDDGILGTSFNSAPFVLTD